MSQEQYVVINLVETNRISFACHVEDNAIIIDECEGMDSLSGLSMFEPWMLGLKESAQ